MSTPKLLVSVFNPEEVGLKKVSFEQLKATDTKESVRDALDIFGGKTGPKTDFALLNAAFALKAADRVQSIGEGLFAARSAIGKPVAEKIREIKAFSQKP